MASCVLIKGELRPKYHEGRLGIVTPKAAILDLQLKAQLIAAFTEWAVVSKVVKLFKVVGVDALKPSNTEEFLRGMQEVAGSGDVLRRLPWQVVLDKYKLRVHKVVAQTESTAKLLHAQVVVRDRPGLAHVDVTVGLQTDFQAHGLVHE